MSHRGKKTKLVIHQNQSSHRHHKSCYLAARHYIFPYQSALQPGLLMVSQSSSFWSYCWFLSLLQEFSLDPPGNRERRMFRLTNPTFFFQLTCLLLEKQIVFSHLSSGGKERNNLHKNIYKFILLTFLLINWKAVLLGKIKAFLTRSLFSKRQRNKFQRKKTLSKIKTVEICPWISTQGLY